MLGQCLGGVVQCDPEEREGLSDGVSHKKQGHPGYCLLDRAGIQSETTPLRPGVQDAQRGRGGAPSSKTSSLKDRFQGCPRHAQQSSSLECGCLGVACVLLGLAPDMFYGARGRVRRGACLTRHPVVGCWVCLGLWLIVLVGRLCCCLPDRVRPRPASGTRAPSEDASDLCTRLDPGGNIVDGLASRGVHHWRGLFRSLRVAPVDFRPGTRPAHPGPAHRRTSAVAFQVPGELLGGGPGCRGLGRGGSSSPPRRAPAGRHIDRLAYQDRCRVLSPQSHNRPLSWCSSRGRPPDRSSPSQILIQVDAAHPLHPGPVGGGSPA